METLWSHTATLLLTLQIATTNVRMVMVIHGANRPPPTIQPRSNQPNSPSSLSHRVINHRTEQPSLSLHYATRTNQPTTRKAQPPISPLRTSSKQDNTSRASHHRTHPLSISHHSSRPVFLSLHHQHQHNSKLKRERNLKAKKG